MVCSNMLKPSWWPLVLLQFAPGTYLVAQHGPWIVRIWSDAASTDVCPSGCDGWFILFFLVLLGEFLTLIQPQSIFRTYMKTQCNCRCFDWWPKVSEKFYCQSDHHTLPFACNILQLFWLYMYINLASSWRISVWPHVGVCPHAGCSCGW